MGREEGWGGVWLLRGKKNIALTGAVQVSQKVEVQASSLAEEGIGQILFTLSPLGWLCSTLKFRAFGGTFSRLLS